MQKVLRFCLGKKIRATELRYEEQDHFTSLHKNHPGRRTAMITAPDVSQSVFAFKALSSE